MTKFYSTPEGFNILKDKLEKVKENQKEALEDLKSAQENGAELSENVEYLEAKDRLTKADNERSYLEDKISKTQIIDINNIKNTEKVVFGSTVKLFDVDKEFEMVYKIVGEEEADIKSNKISYLSPLAKAIMGKSINEEISFDLPNGEDRIVEIISVEHL